PSGVMPAARSSSWATIPLRWIDGLRRSKQSGWKRCLQKSTSATRNTPTESNCLSKHWLRLQTRKWKRAKAAGGKGGASIVPAKDYFEWPYVVLLVGLVVMVAAALHL